MKMNPKFIVLFFMATSMVFLSCSDDDDSSDDNNNNNNSQLVATITNNVKDGNWIITKFIDSGQDETNDFNGYSFSFEDNSVLTATKEANVMTGTWSVTDSDDDDSDDDNPSNDDDDDIDFNIFFNVDDSNNFEDLNDDWDIVSQTSTKIELIDVSGGNGGTDYLTFEKQ
ncbi:hypothetical protein [Mesonia maritima]|uniref:Lipocalin-like domain-containing protein n=1 Tax=Mesonia maritima TaxID=1793873 RepID=A0ABU1K5X4_9FLAO|nr:hypothetical protein [Mesonia maritima]MDR6301013.1 hypothetical protein [Mesonia maritima]